MNTNQRNIGKGFWLAWFLASVMGFGMGAILSGSVAWGLFPRHGFDSTIGITLGIVIGAMGGYVQWVVLRERIPGAGLWGLASALGFGLAMGAMAAVDAGENYAKAGVLIGSAYGVVGGILQWLILRRKVAHAGWWPLANLLGSLVGVMGIPAWIAVSATSNAELAMMTFGLVFGAGYGAITGVALVWLLRRSFSSGVEGLATAQ